MKRASIALLCAFIAVGGLTTAFWLAGYLHTFQWMPLLLTGLSLALGWAALKFAAGRAAPAEDKPIVYCLMPGRITSALDGQTHDITARDLAALYMVRPSDCYVWRKGEPRPATMPGDDEVTFLAPRPDGNYPVFRQEHLLSGEC